MFSGALQKLGKAVGSQTSRQAAKAALPGAALNAAVGTVLGGPVAGVGYAAGDFLLNYPVVAGARKLFPGATETVIDAAGKSATRYVPSRVEQGVNLAASLASAPLTDLVTGGALLPQQVTPADMSQTQQIYQQSLQRQNVNDLKTQALSPGTQYQMQGLEHTFHYPGLTLPPEMLAMLQENQ
jgi:hypothetical protein